MSNPNNTNGPGAPTAKSYDTFATMQDSRSSFTSSHSRRPALQYHDRTTTFPAYHSTRKKPRRWPLVLRFVKGAVHVDIFLAVILHAGWAAIVCWLDTIHDGHLALPSTIIPSLSIVVGLMLVFRNSTSYDRFWQGNQHLTMMVTCIRNLTRSFLTCSNRADNSMLTAAERADVERAVRILLALIYAAKNHLRQEWGVDWSSLLQEILPHGGTGDGPKDNQNGIPSNLRDRGESSSSTMNLEYNDLLPAGTRSFEQQGLSLLLQLSVHIEAFIKRGHDRGWYHAPQASQMTVQLNTLVQSYGNMETIHLTPLPVAYLIHMRQVLALFGCVLPFALVGEMGWYSILMVSFVCFTLYGVEAIGVQLEDPFGYDRNDIKVDAIVEDLRIETGVLLEDWRRMGLGKGGEIFSVAVGK